jgi:hypothetical protein
MTGADLAYIEGLLAQGLIDSPVLELGGGYGGETCRAAIERWGKKYFATDLFPGHGVDLVANFETGEGIERIAAAGPFGTVLVLNVIEHTFDPISVMDRVLSLVIPGGTVVCVTPAVWPIHDHPIDTCRLLPDWYRCFAATRGVILDRDSFRYVGVGRVDSFAAGNGQHALPPPAAGRSAYRVYSRAVHKLFNTFGRGMLQPSHIAIGAVFIRPAAPDSDAAGR